MKLNELAIIGVAATTIVSCTPAKTEYASYELYPVRSGSLTEMEYTPAATQFTLWAPTADEVRLMLFEAGDGGHLQDVQQKCIFRKSVYCLWTGDGLAVPSRIR